MLLFIASDLCMVTRSLDECVFSLSLRFLKSDIVSQLKSRFQPLFDGHFDTGVYPDEWYGGRGMAKEGMTKVHSLTE